jgi:hypothetical protein
MSNDFDFKPDFDFEEFDEFEDFGENLDAEVLMRTAVLQKNNMVALLCIKGANEGAAICRVDPREEHPSVQIYDNQEKALEWFTKSLRTSLKNGWNVVYDGLPLQG